MTQSELSFFKNKETTAGQGDVEKLIGLLSRCSDWISATYVKEVFGWSDRKTRAVASQSTGRIISSDLGYKATAKASPEDFNHFRGRLQHQVTEMTRRIMEAERAWHQRKIA